MRGRGLGLPALCVVLSLVLLLVSPLGRGARGLAAELVRPVRSTAARFVDWIQTRSDRGAVQDRMETLQNHIARLEASVAGQNDLLATLQQQIASARILSAALAQPAPPLLFAPVVLSTDTSTWRRSLLVARGFRDGVRPGQPVVWQHHLLGRVQEESDGLARIQLATDPGFRIAVVPVPTLAKDAAAINARDVAVFEGTGDETGRLKWVSRNQVIQTGWYVVTAGDPLAGIPRGLLVGRIELSNEEMGFRARVRPFVRAHELEQVGILAVDGSSLPSPPSPVVKAQ